MTFLRTLIEAEARTAAAAWAESAPLWEQVVAANPVKGRFWTALADARYQLGEYAAAIAAFERALMLGDGFPAETAYRIACCHAQLGASDEALAWLDRALATGYRDLERARTDRAFAALREQPRYRELVALIETEGLARDDGWRSDLRFLVREIKRRAYDPFRYQSEAAFEAAVSAISAKLPDLTDSQVLVELMILLRSLGDGHAYIAPAADDSAWHHRLPVQFALFEEGVFIIAARPEHQAVLGSRVLAFDGQPITQVNAVLDRLIPRDNENSQRSKHILPGRLRELPLLHALGLVGDPHRVTLTILDRAGKRRDVDLATEESGAAQDERRFPYPVGWTFFPDTLPEPVPLYLRNLTVPYWFTYLRDEQTVFFQFNAVRDAADESLADFCRRLFAFVAEHEVAKLVIDLRWNGGGNTFLEIQLIQHVISSKLNQRGRLFVIIGRSTFSAAQNGAGMMDRYTEAIFVGEPTGSSPTFIGETVPFKLPYSKAEANVSDLLWQTTWPTDYRIWIAPTIYTPPTFAAYRANRDPALEAILSWREHLPGW
jgi:tetratricopeptide (TPR) repeat protein